VWRDGQGAQRQVQVFVDRFLQDAKPRVSVTRYRALDLSCRRFVDYCREHKIGAIDDIGRRDVDAYENWLPAHLSPPSRRKHLEDLRTALNVALDWELIRANPATRFKVRPDYRTKERRALEPDEIRIIQGWPDPERLYAMLGIWAGLRRAEAAYLAWADIDLDRREITLTAKPALGHSPKGTRYRDGRPDRIPMVPWLAESLALWRRTNSVQNGQTLSYVFDKGDGRPLRTPNRWREIIKRRLETSGIHDITIHSFRHSFITMLARAGVNRAVMPSIARHLDATTTDRYVHMELADAHREIRKLVEICTTDCITPTPPPDPSTQAQTAMPVDAEKAAPGMD
jgi:integrase